MYTGYGFRDYEIGDVDIIKHDGVYHLFHLTLPNHDYIAHAVSEDGLNWHRVRNALFIGEPTEWDDDMLWTMHVTPNPYKEGAWRMFYTGLCMRERGRIQRVGLAHSGDLYHWRKDNSGQYPLEISNEHYESSLDEGRHWVSFRDPFFYQENDNYYLLTTARVNHGPIIRRGCVALSEETAENEFVFHPPLFHPIRYDDVEVPSLVKIKDRYYLIGSIREDVKVHYWHAKNLKGPYQNFSDNVLLPQGNYAARIAQDMDKWLVWNFFFKGLSTQGDHLLAPPKELVTDQKGELRLQSFSGFRDLVQETKQVEALMPLQNLYQNPRASSQFENGICRLDCISGLELFLLNGQYRDFILNGHLALEGDGKCGLALRLNEAGDGYYISLDLFKGIVQMRAWGHNETGGIEESFFYDQLQAVHYVPSGNRHDFSLLAYKQYLEFSLDGYVMLTLADDTFTEGQVGFYVESTQVSVDKLEMSVCGGEEKISYPEDLPNY